MDLALPCGDKKTPLQGAEEGNMMSTQERQRKFSPPPYFSFDYETCNPATSQGTASSFLPTCKTHKCPILINHFLSIILFFTELFLHWDIKDWSSLGSLDIPPKGFMSIHHLAVFYWLEASHMCVHT